jgi:excinuclease UvrABC ATPase subunit
VETDDTPEEIAVSPPSYTGQYLKQVLKRRPSSKTRRAAEAAEW